MVITNVNQVVYQGDGVTTAFPFTFRIIDATDIKLLLLDSDGTETDITSDYFVDTENDTVHYPGYAPGAEPALSDRPPVLAEGQKLVIYRKLPITQEKDLGDKWPFYVIELGLDKLTMILQDIWDWLGRCLCVSKGQAYEAGDDFDPTVPLEADKVICGNANGTGYDAREALMEVNGHWDGEGRQIKGVADPADSQDAATKNYVDTLTDNNFMKLQPDGTAWEGRNLPIGNVGGPALVKDAANKDYVDRILAGYSGQGERLAIFDNVAQMQAAELVPSQMAVTLGYHDVNDGGAGIYTIRDKGADTPDGGSIIEIPGTDYVAELIPNGTVNVKQFGAYGDANYRDYSNDIWYKNVDVSAATVAPYIDNVTTDYVKNYVSAVFADEGVYEEDGKHYYSATATEAAYEDNVDGGWYVSATFTTEGTYLNPDDGKHYVSYDIDTDTYSTEAPYHDNVADKWYVTATYSDEGTYTYNSKHWYITDAVETPYYDNVAKKWYVTATYSNQADSQVNGVWYYGATFSTPAQDDTTAIQNALDSGIAVVEFPYGTYKTSDSLLVKSNTIVNGNGSTISIEYNASGQSVIKCEGVSNINVKNFRLTSTGQYSPTEEFSAGVVVSNGAHDILVENIYAELMDGDGFNVSGSNVTPYNITFKNCEAYNCYRNGLSITNGKYINLDGLYIHDFANGSLNAGIDVEGYNPNAQYTTHLNFNNIVIERCFRGLQLCQFGIPLNGVARNIIISDCYLGFCLYSSHEPMVLENDIKTFEVDASISKCITPIYASCWGSTDCPLIIAKLNVAEFTQTPTGDSVSIFRFIAIDENLPYTLNNIDFDIVTDKRYLVWRYYDNIRIGKFKNVHIHIDKCESDNNMAVTQDSWEDSYVVADYSYGMCLVGARNEQSFDHIYTFPFGIHVERIYTHHLSLKLHKNNKVPHYYVNGSEITFGSNDYYEISNADIVNKVIKFDRDVTTNNMYITY